MTRATKSLSTNLDRDQSAGRNERVNGIGQLAATEIRQGIRHAGKSAGDNASVQRSE
jgi:hypothetical protein